MAYGRLPMPTFCHWRYTAKLYDLCCLSSDLKTLVRLPLSVVYARWPRFGQPSVIWSTTWRRGARPTMRDGRGCRDSAYRLQFVCLGCGLRVLVYGLCGMTPTPRWPRFGLLSAIWSVERQFCLHCNGVFRMLAVNLLDDDALEEQNGTERPRKAQNSREWLNLMSILKICAIFW